MLNRDLSHDEIIRYFDKLVSTISVHTYSPPPGTALNFPGGKGCATSLLLPAATAAVPAPQPTLPPWPCCSLPHPSPQRLHSMPIGRTARALN